MSSPPPPYSPQQLLPPPPVYRRPHHQRRPLPHSHSQQPPPALPPLAPRGTSRELLTEALQCAQRAVDLDSSEVDLPAAIAAYDEAIALLQRVIQRRSQKPGIASEVERVTDIHDRYVYRVRELCRSRRIPLPSHVSPPVVPVPVPKEPMPTVTPLPRPAQHRPLPKSPPPPPPLPPLTRAAQIQRLRLKHRSYATDDESDRYPELSPSSSSSSSSSSSKSSTPETPSPVSPVDEEDDPHENGQRWILSAARDEELKEWGKYLDEAGENRRFSAITAASSADWSTVGVSHGDYFH